MPKHLGYFAISVLFLFFIILIGLNPKETQIPEGAIGWSTTPLNWNNFSEVSYIGGDYDASIYSEIFVPRTISEKTPNVYAYMVPSESERLRDSVGDKQLLIHEQYHFNITEYAARLLRKRLVALGEKNSTRQLLKQEYNRFEYTRDSLQNIYDNVSEHNKNYRLQRYWELQIDDLLRQTTDYENPNLYSYDHFRNIKTAYYRHIYPTHEYEILSSFPLLKENAMKGDAYKVETRGDTTVVSHYLNGKLSNKESVFDAAITKIIKKEKQVERLLLDKDGIPTREGEIDRVVSKYTLDGEKIKTYFKNDKQVTYKGVHTVAYTTYDANRVQVNYYNKEGRKIENADGVFGEIRTMDEQGRMISYKNINRQGMPMLDTEFVASYVFTYTKEHQLSSKKLLDIDGRYATHKNNYNVVFKNDESGNLSRSNNLDENDKIADDLNGIAIYRYTYNQNGDWTSIKRFNYLDKPTWGNEEYFMQVRDLDSLQRPSLEATYYPEYVLVFNDDRWGANYYKYLNDSTRILYNRDNYNYNYDDDRGIGIVVQKVDANGNILLEKLMQTDSTYAKTLDGVHIKKYAYDKDNTRTWMTTLDSLQNPVTADGASTATRWEYDQKDNVTSITSLDENGKRARNSLGYSEKRYTYHPTKNSIETITYHSKDKRPAEYFGTHKAIYLTNKWGLDSVVKEYDKNSSLIKGVAITKHQYNQYGKEISVAYFNARDLPALDSERIHHQKYSYNDSHWYTGTSYFDTNGDLTNGSQGYAQEKLIYNNQGYTSSLAYFDANQKPTNGPDNRHKESYYYNDIGLYTRVSYYNKKQRLSENEYGIADYVYERHPSGMISRISYYNKDNNLTETEEGIAEIFYMNELNGLFYTEKQVNSKGDIINDDEAETSDLED